MSSSGGPIAAYRRYWLPELVALAALALASTALFALTDLDIAAARLFHRPELSDPWPVKDRPLWNLFYRSAPWVTGSLAVAGSAVLIAGLTRRKWRRFRVHGLFILLCVTAGPGLIVNGVLKDHWGRPRPRQIVEFGGRLQYAPPLLPAPELGKSFPCGHCSVGYLYGVGWWLWRRSHGRWAAASLAAGVVIGTLQGLGRMAAGGHFLSDVVWSALIALGIAHVLYYYALRIPAREDSRVSVYPRIEGSPSLKTAAIAGAVLLGVGILGGGIVASPHDRDLTARIRFADFPAAPETLEVLADTLDVEIRLVAEATDAIECTGHIHGFGLPTNEIRASWEFEARPVPTLRYRVDRKGWFPDIEGVTSLRVPRQALRRIIVRVGRGDIRVVEAPDGGPGAGPLPALDLHTAEGRVRRP